MATETSTLYEITRDVPRCFSSERLPFILPDFTRHAWTSEVARATWEPRIARILQAWQDVEWLSVAAGVRDCALMWIADKSLQQFISKWEATQLSAVGLDFATYNGGNNQSTSNSVSGMTCIVIGALDKTEQLRDAWQQADEDTIGALLGYPPCCRAFFRDVWATQGYIDTTWAMAENTSVRAKYGVVKIELPSHLPPLANILWRWLGVRAVPHLPCRFDCSASIEFGMQMLEIARLHGYSEEADWITEILSWPVEWSALHGIAEVKSPLMKLSTRTDATAGKWTVQWLGSDYPKEGSVGVNFPYRPPKRLSRTSSRQAPVELADDADGSWQYGDNGFASLAAMEELHKPIVALAREALADETGNVLDLGCGNGMLLSKVCAERSDLIPHGVDSNPLILEHARHLLPQFAKNFVHGDLFEIELWSSRGYALAILMLGRLLEVPTEKAIKMIGALQTSCSRVLVYMYPDWQDRSLEAIARQFDLTIVKCEYANSVSLCLCGFPAK